MRLAGKHVLVTGADGFIGSHLVERLMHEGCRVRAFVLYNSFNSWGWLDTFSAELLNQIEIFMGDIRDTDRVKQAIQDIDLVFHLVALISIPYSYYSPHSYVDTNIVGTLNVLQAARELKTPRVLTTSTSEVYGTAQYVPIDESHPLQGQSPYSATKISADKITESFYRSFDTPVSIVRPFNTYGPRQSARAIVSTIIVQLLSGVNPIKLGNLNTSRDFNYIQDTISGFIEIAKSDKTVGEEINIASQIEVAIKQLAETLIEIIDPKVGIVPDEKRFRPERSEVYRLLGSNQKLIKLTEWKPEYSLKRGLEETIDWFAKEDNLRLYKYGLYNI